MKKLHLTSVMLGCICFKKPNSFKRYHLFDGSRDISIEVIISKLPKLHVNTVQYLIKIFKVPKVMDYSTIYLLISQFDYQDWPEKSNVSHF